MSDGWSDDDDLDLDGSFDESEPTAPIPQSNLPPPPPPATSSSSGIMAAEALFETHSSSMEAVAAMKREALLTDKVKQLEGTVERLEEQLELGVAEQQQNYTQLVAAKEEASIKGASEAELQQGVASLRQQLEQAEEDNRALQQENSQDPTATAELSTQVSELTSQKEAAEANTQALQQQLAAHASEQTSQKEEAEATTAVLQQQLAHAVTAAEELHQKLAHAEATEAAAEAATSDLQQKLAHAEATNSAADAATSDLQQQLVLASASSTATSDLQHQLARAEATNSALESELESSSAWIKEAQTSMASMASENESAHARLAESETLAGQVSFLQSAAASHEQQVQSLSESLSTLSTEKESALQQAAQLQQSLEAAVETHGGSSELLRQTQVQLEELVKKTVFHDAQTTQLEAEKESALQQAAQLQQSLEAAVETHGGSSELLRQTQVQLEELVKKTVLHDAQTTQLEAEKESALQQAAQLQQSLEAAVEMHGGSSELLRQTQVQLEELVKKTALHDAQTTQLEAEKESALQQAAQLQQSLEAAIETHGGSGELLRQTQAQLEVLVKKAVDEKAELGAAHETLTAQLEQLHKRAWEEAALQLASAQEQTSQLEESLQAATAGSSDMLQKALSRENALKEELRSLQSQLAATQTEINSQTAASDSAKQQLAECDCTIQNLTDELLRLNAAVDPSTAPPADAALDELIEENEALKQNLEQWTAWHANEAKVQEETTVRLAEYEEHATMSARMLEEQVEVTASRESEWLERYSALQEELLGAQGGDLPEKGGEATALQQENEALKLNYNHNLAALEREKETSESLKTQLSSASAHASSLQASVPALEGEVDRLSEELRFRHSTSDELASTIAENDRLSTLLRETKRDQAERAVADLSQHLYDSEMQRSEVLSTLAAERRRNSTNLQQMRELVLSLGPANSNGGV